MLDKLIKLYSLSGALLIFCGVLKLIIYYSYFSIDIIEFLTFSEIITSFLDDINILIVFGIVMLVTSVMAVNFIEKRVSVSFEEFFNAIFPYKNGYVIFFTIVLSLLIGLLKLKLVSTNYFVIYSIAFCSIQLFSYLFMYKSDTGEITFSDNKVGLGVSISFIFVIYLLAQHDIEQTVNKRRNVRLVINSSTIYDCGVSKNIFVGKTDNYIFISSNSANSTVVLPSSDIKQYSFTKRH